MPSPDHRIFSYSLRELAEYIASSGDLSTARVSVLQGMEGTRAHRRLQKERPAPYEAEVPLHFVWHSDKIQELRLNGRADGVWERLAEEGLPVVEEIKSTRAPLDTIEQPGPAHLLQGQLYAALLARERSWPRCEVWVTYIHLDRLETRSFKEVYSAEELWEIFTRACETLGEWLTLLADWRETRDATMPGTPFPFRPFRPGQVRLSKVVMQVIETGGRLHAEAPTGIGKTLAVLYAAAKAVGLGRAEKLFYLTARGSVKAAAVQALDQLADAGLRFKRVVLTAKEQSCNRNGTPCDAVECPFAIGYYDRIHPAVADLFQAEDAWTPEVIDRYADKHQVCPFEYSLDMALWADAIIGDYNYVFDPGVRLRRFFDQGPTAHVLLVDEAHNLPGRARDMYSAELRKDQVMELKRAAREHAPSLERPLSDINHQLLACRREAGMQEADAAADGPREKVLEGYPEELERAVRRAAGAAETALRIPELDPTFRQSLFEFYRELTAFVAASERFDDQYYSALYGRGRKAEWLKLFCRDPSEELRSTFGRVHAAILFSASLSPARFYLDATGADAETTLLRLSSPFPPEHLELRVRDDLSTLYRDRAASAPAVADAIRTFIEEEEGNYLIFFPSYGYLQEVLRCYQGMHRRLLQQPGMTEEERAFFLSEFSHDNPGTLAGFAVMGGIFGEAVDLVGDRLKGAVVVGVGLPQVNLEQELIRRAYAARGCDGFDYAYTYPGWCRVLQAVGRVIRSEKDRGRVLLIDRRFGQARYRALFPPWWHPGR